MTRKQKKLLTRIIVSLVFFAAGFFLKSWWQMGFMLAAWLLAGYDVLWEAIVNIFHGQLFDEKFLMGLATCGALGMKDWKEAAAVMIFFQVGELFESVAVSRSRQSISALMDLRPDRAVVLRDGEEVEVEPEEVQMGDVLLVRAGERIPVDGTVVEGEASLDTAKVTGESMPVEVAEGSEVISGSVNLNGVLKIRANSAYEQSTVARILSLVESAAEKKANAERLITKFAKYYTPSVVIAAVLLAAVPPLAFHQPFMDWLPRALTFLVISCPCALVISVPLAFFSGMGAAAKLGVVVKGGVTLEQLAKTTTFVFDKTGTLTAGEFSIRKVLPEERRGEILRLASLCEQYSNHPISRTIREAVPNPEGEATDIMEMAGNGITAVVDGKKVAVGNHRLMEKCGVTLPEIDEAGTVLFVAAEGECLGAIVIGDKPREGVPEMLETLHKHGVRRTVMLTGDNKASAQQCAQACGITEFRAQLLPQDKVTHVEALLAKEKSKGALAFVGDGVNDAPVLTMADVGIAMGGVGSDAAVEAADAVILNDDITKLPALLRIAKRTCLIAKENIVFALAVKAACLVLGAFGIASVWMSVFADVGVAVIAILNALRAMRRA